MCQLAAVSVGTELFPNQEFYYHNMELYHLSVTNLETCTKALATGNLASLDDVNLGSMGGNHDTFTMQ